jgi:phage protein D
VSQWTTTVRAKGKVSRERHSTLEEALESAGRHAGQASLRPNAQTVDLKVREYAPSAQVSVRIEVSGPGRLLPAVRAGLDVRGDGSTVAWTGRLQRTVIEPQSHETATDALRRAVGA